MTRRRKASTARPDPDSDVFVPPAPAREPVADADGDDDDVFIPEAPVFRKLQSEGVGQSWYPMRVADPEWRCPYGCPGVRNVAADLEWHTWDCPYWQHEGRNETPF